MPSQAETKEFVADMKAALNTSNTEAVDHLKAKHQGIPATTCHDCIGLASHIRFLKDTISHYEAIFSQMSE